jgi:hypothetical protein
MSICSLQIDDSVVEDSTEHTRIVDEAVIC